MAVARIGAKCRSCGNEMLLRVGMAPAPEMRVRCQCPYCGVALRLRFDIGDASAQMRSEDVSECVASPDEAIKSLVLYTDLPVHRSLLGRSAKEPASAFLLMVPLWGERAGEYSGRGNDLYRLRTQVFPDVRRAASLYAQGDMARLQPAVDRLAAAGLAPRIGSLPAVYRLARAIDLSYMPLVDISRKMLATHELISVLMAADQRDPALFLALLGLLRDDLGFDEYRRQVVETAMLVLDHIDALLPGLAWEHVIDAESLDIDDFRIVRDDFNELRARYVDIFELASRTLVYLGSIINIATRGDSTAWAQGKPTALHTMLRRPAAAREFILDELPRAKAYYDDIHRHSRNAFGHYNIEYDFEHGELVDQRSGERTNFLLFMSDYLGAARLTGYLLTVAEKLTITMLEPGGIGAHVRQVEHLGHQWPTL